MARTTAPDVRAHCSCARLPFPSAALPRMPCPHLLLHDLPCSPPLPACPFASETPLLDRPCAFISPICSARALTPGALSTFCLQPVNCSTRASTAAARLSSLGHVGLPARPACALPIASGCRPLLLLLWARLPFLGAVPVLLPACRPRCCNCRGFRRSLGPPFLSRAAGRQADGGYG